MPTAPHRPVLSRRDRRRESRARGGERLHLHLQHDRPAGGDRAVRLHEGRLADRPSDRRPALRRRDRAARLGGLRGGAPVGAAAPRPGLAMKAGVNLLNWGPGVSPEALARTTALIEALGYHLVMISDHVAPTPDVAAKYPTPLYDPFTTLGWLAAATRSIELGTTVIILPYRNPVLTARMAATIDRLSGGRFIFGVGVGWAQQEFEALGVPFAPRRHLERLPGGDQDLVDTRRRVVHGPVRLVQGRAHRSAARTLATSTDLD